MVSASSLTREKPNFFLSPMTTTFRRPTAVGGSPEPGNNPEQRSREASNRLYTQLLNQKERHHRQNMASHEALSEQVKSCQLRTDVGVGEVLKMQMHTEDARKEDSDATKESLAVVTGLLGSILKELQGNDFLRIPKEERQFTENPDEEL